MKTELISQSYFNAGNIKQEYVDPEMVFISNQIMSDKDVDQKIQKGLTLKLPKGEGNQKQQSEEEVLAVKKIRDSTLSPKMVIKDTFQTSLHENAQQFIGSSTKMHQDKIDEIDELAYTLQKSDVEEKGQTSSQSQLKFQVMASIEPTTIKNVKDKRRKTILGMDQANLDLLQQQAAAQDGTALGAGHMISMEKFFKLKQSKEEEFARFQHLEKQYLARIKQQEQQLQVLSKKLSDKENVYEARKNIIKNEIIGDLQKQYEKKERAIVHTFQSEIRHLRSIRSENIKAMKVKDNTIKNMGRMLMQQECEVMQQDYYKELMGKHAFDKFNVKMILHKKLKKYGSKDEQELLQQQLEDEEEEAKDQKSKAGAGILHMGGFSTGDDSNSLMKVSIQMHLKRRLEETTEKMLITRLDKEEQMKKNEELEHELDAANLISQKLIEEKARLKYANDKYIKQAKDLQIEIKQIQQGNHNHINKLLQDHHNEKKNMSNNQQQVQLNYERELKVKNTLIERMNHENRILRDTLFKIVKMMAFPRLVHMIHKSINLDISKVKHDIFNEVTDQQKQELNQEEVISTIQMLNKQFFTKEQLTKTYMRTNFDRTKLNQQLLSKSVESMDLSTSQNQQLPFTKLSANTMSGTMLQQNLWVQQNYRNQSKSKLQTHNYDSKGEVSAGEQVIYQPTKSIIFQQSKQKMQVQESSQTRLNQHTFANTELQGQQQVSKEDIELQEALTYQTIHNPENLKKRFLIPSQPFLLEDQDLGTNAILQQSTSEQQSTFYNSMQQKIINSDKKLNQQKSDQKSTNIQIQDIVQTDVKVSPKNKDIIFQTTNTNQQQLESSPEKQVSQTEHQANQSPPNLLVMSQKYEHQTNQVQGQPSEGKANAVKGVSRKNHLQRKNYLLKQTKRQSSRAGAQGESQTHSNHNAKPDQSKKQYDQVTDKSMQSIQFQQLNQHNMLPRMSQGGTTFLENHATNLTTLNQDLKLSKENLNVQPQDKNTNLDDTLEIIEGTQPDQQQCNSTTDAENRSQVYENNIVQSGQDSHQNTQFNTIHSNQYKRKKQSSSQLSNYQGGYSSISHNLRSQTSKLYQTTTSHGHALNMYQEKKVFEQTAQQQNKAKNKQLLDNLIVNKDNSQQRIIINPKTNKSRQNGCQFKSQCSQKNQSALSTMMENQSTSQILLVQQEQDFNRNETQVQYQGKQFKAQPTPKLLVHQQKTLSNTIQSQSSSKNALRQISGKGAPHGSQQYHSVLGRKRSHSGATASQTGGAVSRTAKNKVLLQGKQLQNPHVYSNVSGSKQSQNDQKIFQPQQNNQSYPLKNVHQIDLTQEPQIVERDSGDLNEYLKEFNTMNHTANQFNTLQQSETCSLPRQRARSNYSRQHNTQACSTMNQRRQYLQQHMSRQQHRQTFNQTQVPQHMPIRPQSSLGGTQSGPAENWESKAELVDASTGHTPATCQQTTAQERNQFIQQLMQSSSALGGQYSSTACNQRKVGSQSQFQGGSTLSGDMVAIINKDLILNSSSYYIKESQNRNLLGTTASKGSSQANQQKPEQENGILSAVQGNSLSSKVNRPNKDQKQLLKQGNKTTKNSKYFLGAQYLKRQAKQFQHNQNSQQHKPNEQVFQKQKKVVYSSTVHSSAEKLHEQVLISQQPQQSSNVVQQSSQDQNLQNYNFVVRNTPSTGNAKRVQTK